MYGSMKSLCCRVSEPQSQAISPVERDEHTAARGAVSLVDPRPKRVLLQKEARILGTRKEVREIGPRPAAFSLIGRQSRSAFVATTMVRLLESPPS